MGMSINFKNANLRKDIIQKEDELKHEKSVASRSIRKNIEMPIIQNENFTILFSIQLFWHFKDFVWHFKNESTGHTDLSSGFQLIFPFKRQSRKDVL